MLYKTTSILLKESETAFLYPELRAAYMAISSRSKRKEILDKLGVERTWLWRLLNKRQGDEPMRTAYLIILNKELLDQN